LNLILDRTAAFFKTLPPSTKVSNLTTEEVKNLEQNIISLNDEQNPGTQWQSSGSNKND